MKRSIVTPNNTRQSNNTRQMKRSIVTPNNTRQMKRSLYQTTQDK